MGGIPSFRSSQVSPNNENPRCFLNKSKINILIVLFTKNNTFPVGKNLKSNCFIIPCNYSTILK